MSFIAALVDAEGKKDPFHALGEGVKRVRALGGKPLYCQVGRYVDLPDWCPGFFGIALAPVLVMPEGHIRVVGVIGDGELSGVWGGQSEN